MLVYQVPSTPHRVFFKIADLFLELGRIPSVIGVDSRRIGLGNLVESLIEGFCQSDILFIVDKKGTFRSQFFLPFLKEG